MKIGIVQMKTLVGGYSQNLEYAVKQIEQCTLQNCDLVCLPEAFSTTIDFGNISQTAETVPGRTTDVLCRLARLNSISIIAGIMERQGQTYYSSVVFVDETGRISGHYRRIHIFELEKRFLGAGSHLSLIDTKWGKIGLLAGYDINFPELCRKYFEHQAALIVCPCQIPDTFVKSTVSLAKARACESNCYFALASSIGKNSLAGFDYMGGSLVAQGGDAFDFISNNYFPQQEILVSARQEEVLLVCDLDMQHKNMELRRNPHREDMLGNYSDLEVRYD